MGESVGIDACTLYPTRLETPTKEANLAASGKVPWPGSSQPGSKAPLPLVPEVAAIDKGQNRGQRDDMFKRRLGPDPHAGGAKTAGLKGCPDIFELETGDFAVIGRDITPEASGQLPSGASCGPEERIIVIPRRTLVKARPDIPETV